MSELAFHTNVPDRFGYAYKGLAKAQKLNMRACVLFEHEQELIAFDQFAWTCDKAGFVAHGKVGSPEAAHGAACLSTNAAELPECDILFLLTRNAPHDIVALLERFPKIIDIVPNIDPELTEGRRRYVAYRKLGLEMKVYDRAAAR